MPPKKRTLAEADSSAANGPPAPAKRPGRPPKAGKENSKQSSSTSASNGKAAVEKPAANKPGRKPKAVSPSESSKSKPVQKQPGRRGSKKQANGQASGKSDADDDSVPEAPPAPKPNRPDLDTDYVTISAPTTGEEPETESNEKMNMLHAEDHPNWKWIVTRKAARMVQDMSVEAQKRDQDQMGLHVYNDFTGYGLQEVIENALVEFHKSYSKVDTEPATLWDHIQAIALWFKLYQPIPWGGMDDGERVSATLHVLGTAILSVLNTLERKDLLKKNSSIKNISLTLSLCLNIAETFSDALDMDLINRPIRQQWPSQIVGYLRHHNIELSDRTGIEGTDRFVSGLPIIRYEDFEKKTGKSAVDRWGFKIMWNAYHTRWSKKEGRGPKRLGGDGFDITKWQKGDRVKYSLSGRDPLEGDTHAQPPVAPEHPQYPPQPPHPM